jgi:5-methyltetrahydrofolate--homocysteine methyltransferase
MIHFSPERWERVRENYRRWWAGELDRPLLAVTVSGHEPDRAEPPLPTHGFTSFYGDDVPPAAIVDVWDYALSAQRYLGDAFPRAGPGFGPGVCAAFSGCQVQNGEGTVWFRPEQVREPAEIHLALDRENRWFRRAAGLYAAAVERWQGAVQLDMTDLGGNLDIVAAFRTTENLLLDLYDHPQEVKRLLWEAHQLWWDSFAAFNAIIRPSNPGSTAWVPILSEEPYYILQCDFAYMIGPDMFREFVLPELQATCRRLGHAFYHLDGIGQLPHLDALLSLPELDGIQWVMGDGQPEAEHWGHVYRRIREAGKLLQVSSGHTSQGFKVIDFLAEATGSGRGIIITGQVPCRREPEMRELLRRYGAE